MLTKIKLLKDVEKFPDEFSMDELVERLIVIDKIENGRKQSVSGQTVSEAELNNEFEKWFEYQL